jgi:GNAT superfamily N-acetyltransferase
MRLRFRDATAADAPAIAALHNAAAGALTALHGQGPWSALTSEKAATPMQVAGRSRVRVGCEGRKVVTVLQLATRKPWAIDARFFTPVDRPLYLTGMVVAVTHQRQGAGRAALGDAEAVARAWPVDAIRLDAWDAPAGAGGFYAQCGYADRGATTYRGTPLVYRELLLLAE